MAAITQSRPASSTPTIRTPLFVVGVGLALLAFLLMFAFGALFANRTQNVTQVKVVLAATDIAQREPITVDELTYGTVASTSLPPHAITNVTALTGSTAYSALVTIYKGEVITANVVSSNPDQLATSQSQFLPIPKGYVALTLPASEQMEVGGFVAQGDYIDIMAQVNTGLITPLNPRQVAKTVFTEVYVIRVGPESTVARQGVAQGLTSSITVVMSLCDAQYMFWLVQNASLKYVLLDYSSYSAPPTTAPDCPSTTEPGIVGPAQVDARWGFTR